MQRCQVAVPPCQLSLSSDGMLLLAAHEKGVTVLCEYRCVSAGLDSKLGMAIKENPTGNVHHAPAPLKLRHDQIGS